MLDDRERKLLFEIERRLLIDDPELVGSFGSAPPHRLPAHHHGAVFGKVAGLTLCAVLWIGPRPLTDAEVVTRTAAGPPRVTPTSTGVTAIPVQRRPLPCETRRSA
ncbi:DUF3040 domain-containing protein [Pseudonocardia sp. KRD291]|uniref:DUF3040 domain-containing protein n=1 Tax=Pseudonocardia sp. KRD291 TaxID=2792007 RepID=UPI001C4A68E6|nr:DUF3040 domain-containing protein [Pseudonocardia sp. KRD291]MBW0101807.1 DUF3040 domain-containing protein [Pseudonocardia sp. KRD291]